MAEIDLQQEVLIYIKPTCPFCIKALRLLEEKGFRQVTVKDIAAQPDLKPEMIAKANGRKTVPQVFFGSRHIGGCDDLHDYLGKAFSDTGMFCTLD